jgi:hypothetical protein
MFVQFELSKAGEVGKIAYVNAANVDWIESIDGERTKVYLTGGDEIIVQGGVRAAADNLNDAIWRGDELVDDGLALDEIEALLGIQEQDCCNGGSCRGKDAVMAEVYGNKPSSKPISKKDPGVDLSHHFKSMDRFFSQIGNKLR